jgi:hypothetical protein
VTHTLGWLVESYGAVADGSSDCAPAFNALVAGMITRLSTDTTQQHVALRPKVYRINTPIVINASGLQFHGHNRVGSIIEGSPSFPAGSPLIDVVAGGGNTQLRDIHIGNITLRRTGTTSLNGPLIRLSGMLCATVSNCILGACGTGPYITVTKPGTAANLMVHLRGLDCTGAPTTGILANQCDALHVVDCKIKAATTGLSITTGGNCSAERVIFQDCGTAISLATTVTNFMFIGGGRQGAVTTWIASDSSCSGHIVGRRLTTAPPGQWDMMGPLDS